MLRVPLSGPLEFSVIAASGSAKATITRTASLCGGPMIFKAVG
jgi:hypothetical protein